jgi:hypothetical protein
MMNARWILFVTTAVLLSACGKSMESSSTTFPNPSESALTGYYELQPDSVQSADLSAPKRLHMYVNDKGIETAEVCALNGSFAYAEWNDGLGARNFSYSPSTHDFNKVNAQITRFDGTHLQLNGKLEYRRIELAPTEKFCAQ